MRELLLSRGETCLVDDDVYEWASQYSYYRSYYGYAVRGDEVDGKKIIRYLHREIMGMQEGGKVDHIDGNRLNNLRSNLRPATQSQNMCNRGAPKSNKSGFKGVWWDEERNRWQAYIRVNGKRKFLGRYTDKISAALAYNEAAVRFHGEFARLNVIAEEASV